jgi:hypothetical protein
MDPYQTLGVPRGCTPEAAKDAFRARAWQAHPDRGGEEIAFIRLCTAYKQVLAELNSSPRPAIRNPARPAREGRGRRPPIPNWEPDLIVGAQPPDPSWEPDLIVLDEPAGDQCSPEPPDPQIDRERYRAWLGRFSAQAAGAQSVWRSGWVRAFGMILFLSLVLANLWVCWIVWSDDPGKAESSARPATIRFEDVDPRNDRSPRNDRK